MENPLPFTRPNRLASKTDREAYLGGSFGLRIILYGLLRPPCPFPFLHLTYGKVVPASFVPDDSGLAAADFHGVPLSTLKDLNTNHLSISYHKAWRNVKFRMTPFENASVWGADSGLLMASVLPFAIDI